MNDESSGPLNLWRRQSRDFKLFAAYALGLAVILYIGAWATFVFSGAPPNTWPWKAGETLASLGTVAVSGILIALLLEWFKRSHARDTERRLEEVDFLRRLREVYVALATARATIIVQDDVDTYRAKFQEIFLAWHSLEEIRTDLEHAPDVFPGPGAQKSRRKGLIDALQALAALTRVVLVDYTKSLEIMSKSAPPPKRVRSDLLPLMRNSGAPGEISGDTGDAVSTFLSTLDETGKRSPDEMIFGLPNNFDRQIEASKGVMRRYVYGTDDSNDRR